MCEYDRGPKLYSKPGGPCHLERQLLHGQVQLLCPRCLGRPADILLLAVSCQARAVPACTDMHIGMCTAPSGMKSNASQLLRPLARKEAFKPIIWLPTAPRCFYVCDAASPDTSAEVRSEASFTVADPVQRQVQRLNGRHRRLLDGASSCIDVCHGSACP